MKATNKYRVFFFQEIIWPSGFYSANKSALQNFISHDKFVTYLTLGVTVILGDTVFYKHNTIPNISIVKEPCVIGSKTTAAIYSANLLMSDNMVTSVVRVTNGWALKYEDMLVHDQVRGMEKSSLEKFAQRQTLPIDGREIFSNFDIGFGGEYAPSDN